MFSEDKTYNDNKKKKNIKRNDLSFTEQRRRAARYCNIPKRKRKRKKVIKIGR